MPANADDEDDDHGHEVAASGAEQQRRHEHDSAVGVGAISLNGSDSAATNSAAVKVHAITVEPRAHAHAGANGNGNSNWDGSAQHEDIAAPEAVHPSFCTRLLCCCFATRWSRFYAEQRLLVLCIAAYVMVDAFVSIRFAYCARVGRSPSRSQRMTSCSRSTRSLNRALAVALLRFLAVHWFERCCCAGLNFGTSEIGVCWTIRFATHIETHCDC